MNSAIEVLKAHRDVCVEKSVKAASRSRMTEWEKWSDKANDACEALAVLFGKKELRRLQHCLSRKS
jgi:hypothetical protein